MTTKITVYRHSKPLKGARVSLGFDGLFNLGHTGHYLTNSDGVAFVDHSSSGIATIYVNGSAIRKLKTPGEDIIYL